MPEHPSRADDSTATSQAPELARHDPDELLCPVCWTPFTRVRRQRYCTDACRRTAYNRRQVATGPAASPADRPSTRSRDVTIYACPTCRTRSYGDPWCHGCHHLSVRIGLGGRCPHCDQPVALTDLLDTPPEPPKG